MSLESNEVPEPIVDAASNIDNEPKVAAPPNFDTDPLVSRYPKMRGRELYESLGSPKTVVAPMVDQSELAWRILSRRHGADLCYTPMYHARLFATSEAYRNDMFCEADGDAKTDRPLVVQFCANKPEELLAAAKLVEDRCDAVDLNLGCPQGIARRGRYGAFLMEDWDLVWKLINTLHKELKVPVTAKIRIYEDKEKTLAYAKHVLSAGAQFLTVHGRTREMKGQQTGIADWDMIKFLRENLPEDTVMISNGNVLYPEDVDRSIEYIGVDAVMSAEGNLYNPCVFNRREEHGMDARFPRVDKILREYFEIVKSTPGQASRTAMKSHFFKMLHKFLSEHTDIRSQLGQIRKGEIEEYEAVVKAVEERVAKIYESEEAQKQDVMVEDSVMEEWGGSYKEIPYWRTQPYFRTVNGVKVNGEKVNVKRKRENESEEPNKKREE